MAAIRQMEKFRDELYERINQYRTVDANGFVNGITDAGRLVYLQIDNVTASINNVYRKWDQTDIHPKQTIHLNYDYMDGIDELCEF